MDKTLMLIDEISNVTDYEAESENLIDCLERLLLLCKQMRDKEAVIVQHHLVNF